MFHLNHPDRRQQIFIKNVSLHFSIHPSFSNVSCSSATAQHHDFPTSKFHLQTSQLVWCFWGDMCCLFSTKHSVYYGIQRVQFLFNLTRLYPPILLQACPNVVQQTEKAHATCFFFSNGILCHECAYRPLFSLTQLYLQIFFTPLCEILRWALGRGWFMEKLCSFHFQIMAPTMLAGTFSSLEILL